MEEIKDLSQFETAAKDGKAIMYFTAGWCPDCWAIKPALPKIVENFPEYNFYTVNRDNLIDLCRDLDIFGIPSFVAFDSGEEIGRLVNKDRKTQEEVESFIKSL